MPFLAQMVGSEILPRKKSTFIMSVVYYDTVHYSRVLYSTVHYKTVEYITKQNSKVQHRTIP